MTDAEWFDQVADVPEARWPEAEDVPIDRRKKFRRFRELVEGGESFVVTAGGPTAVIASGSITSPASGPFSDPWKLLTDDQFLRLEGTPGSVKDGAAAPDAVFGRELRSRRDALLRQIAPAPDAGPTVSAGLLHDQLGGCLVVRGFDSSELTAVGGAAVSSASAAPVLSALQSGASRRGLAVAFPYLDRSDEGLLEALQHAGFVFGSVTATNIFDLPQSPSFEAVLGQVPGRVRYRFRKEWNDFHASGYTLHELDLGLAVGEFVELEARNRVKHGGVVNLEKLTALRLSMARLLGAELRVKGARDAAGNLVAAGIDLVDGDRYLGLVYGQDDDRVNEHVYPTLVYGWPLRQAVEHHIGSVRMGFEAFHPKVLRGSRLEKRVFAFWHPDPEVTAATGHLLALLDERLADGVLSRARTRESFTDHWSFLAGAQGSISRGG